MKYVVAQYTIKNGNIGGSDDVEFDSKEEAIEFFDSIDLKDKFYTEVNCSSVKYCKDKIFCKEIVAYDTELDEVYGDGYEDYGYEQYMNDFN